MRKRIEWCPEQLDERAWRVAVIGGWLVGHNKDDGKRLSESMCFVPDTNHEWSILPRQADPKIERSDLAKDFVA